MVVYRVNTHKKTFFFQPDSRENAFSSTSCSSAAIIASFSPLRSATAKRNRVPVHHATRRPSFVEKFKARTPVSRDKNQTSCRRTTMKYRKPCDAVYAREKKHTHTHGEQHNRNEFLRRTARVLLEETNGVFLGGHEQRVSRKTRVAAAGGDVVQRQTAFLRARNTNERNAHSLADNHINDNTKERNSSYY